MNLVTSGVLNPTQLPEGTSPPCFTEGGDSRDTLNLIRGLLFADNQFDERLQALTMTDYKYQGSGNFVMKLR